MYTDIQKYCTTYTTCQKTCTACKSDQAFLQPLPVVFIPFYRIAMDTVGPLVKSSSGHQYILVCVTMPPIYPLLSLFCMFWYNCCPDWGYWMKS